ncbi:hypothetical protein GGF31_002834 [Allomyces arbusculus]|nr:hypothetical protein GGF31_002834 [Allomyces arbusculus]
MLSTVPATLLLAAALATALVHAHSWADCVDLAPDGKCRGFGRGYPGRGFGVQTDALYTSRIDNRNPSTPLCDPARQARSSPTAYTNQFPMTTATPGQSLTTVWKPNGHIANPNPIRILCFPRGIKTMLRGDLDKPASVSGILEVGRMRFNTNCKDPKDPFTDCSDAFTVPAGWRNGESYACVWFWNFDGNPAGEEYSTCFDIKVAATAASASSGNGATGFESGAAAPAAPAAPVVTAAPAAPAMSTAPAVPAAPAAPAATVAPAAPASPAKSATPSAAPSSAPSAKKPSMSLPTPPPSKFAPRPKAAESVPVPQSVVITPPQPLPKITVSRPSTLPSVPAQAKSMPAVQLPVLGKSVRDLKEVVANAKSRVMAAHKRVSEMRMGIPFRAMRASETEETK